MNIVCAPRLEFDRGTFHETEAYGITGVGQDRFDTADTIGRDAQCAAGRQCRLTRRVRDFCAETSAARSRLWEVRPPSRRERATARPPVCKAARRSTCGSTSTPISVKSKDDFPDFFFGRADAPCLFAVSDGRGRFTVTAAPAASRSARAAQLVDDDNDGTLDLLTWSADRPRLFRNRGARWDDVTAGAPERNATAGAARPAPTRMFAAGDVDLDGATDMVTADPAGALFLFRNDVGTRNRSLRVQLEGRVSNRSAVGSKIQIRAGSLGARTETSATTPRMRLVRTVCRSSGTFESTGEISAN